MKSVATEFNNPLNEDVNAATMAAIINPIKTLGNNSMINFGYTISGFGKFGNNLIAITPGMMIKNNKLTTENNQVILFSELKKGEYPTLGSIAFVNNIEAKGSFKLNDKTQMSFVNGKLADIKMPNRLLNENVLNGTILMILITCTIASFVAQKGAYNIALAENDETDSEDDVVIESDEKILIPMKSVDSVDELINLAVTIKSKKNKTGLFALNVISNNASTAVLESKAQKIVKRAAVVASSTDNSLNMLMRYDLNILNGVSSVFY